MRIAGIILLVILIVAIFLFIRLNNGPARADWKEIPFTQVPAKVLDTLRKQVQRQSLQGITCLDDSCGKTRIEYSEVNVPLFNNYRVVKLMIGKMVLEMKETDFKPPYIIMDKIIYYAERNLTDSIKHYIMFSKPLE